MRGDALGKTTFHNGAAGLQVAWEKTMGRVPKGKPFPSTLLLPHHATEQGCQLSLKVQSSEDNGPRAPGSYNTVKSRRERIELGRKGQGLNALIHLSQG